mmetsp:Transcript_89730/g.239756  ORF Transcript_89730/g.239756 Transcript_89730/m.239756 type:complete len:93 (+) Transcript_89730:323-601(+)
MPRSFLSVRKITKPSPLCYQEPPAFADRACKQRARSPLGSRRPLMLPLQLADHDFHEVGLRDRAVPFFGHPAVPRLAALRRLPFLGLGIVER